MPLPRHKAKYLSEPKTISLDHGSTAATLNTKVWKVPAGRSFRITRVLYNNPTGLVANAGNFFTITALNAALTAYAINTSAVSLGADVPVELVATPVNIVLPANTILTIALALTGAATLPAGRVVIEGDLF